MYTLNDSNGVIRTKKVYIALFCFGICFSLLACSNHKSTLTDDFSEAASAVEDDSSDDAQTSETDYINNSQEVTSSATTVKSANPADSKAATPSKTTTAPKAAIPILSAPKDTPSVTGPTKAPTLPSDFITPTSPSSSENTSSENTTTTNVDQTNNEPTTDDAYNLYLYSLYIVSQSKDYGISSLETIRSKSNSRENWNTELHARINSDSLIMKITSFSDSGEYRKCQSWYYDGKYMYFNNYNDNIYYPISKDEMVSSDSSAVWFLSDEVTSFKTWDSGGGLIGINYTIKPNQSIKSLEAEFKGVMFDKDVTLNTVKSYTCNAYINMHTYFLERFEIWVNADCTVNGNKENFDYQLGEYYNTPGSSIDKPSWTSDSTLVEN